MSPSSGQMGKDMDKMETSITDLQGSLDVANERPKKPPRRPGRLFLVVLVVLLVGLGVFLLTTRVLGVDSNAEVGDKDCLLRNEQIQVVNEKFSQLVSYLDASLAHRSSGQPPPSEAVLALYDDFRKPIEVLECDR